MTPDQLQLLDRENVFNAVAEGIQDSLKPVLPTSQEESRVEKVRRVMGEDVKNLSDQELDVYLTEFSFLLDSWLDSYEQTAFEGKTLKQLLREG